MVSAMVVHQHTNNFGDDVAGSALVLGLLEMPQVDRVDVHYIWQRGGGGLPVTDERVSHTKLNVLAGQRDQRPMLAILAALLAFWRVSPSAGALLLPYLLWVTYAATLNWGFWRIVRAE